jgi:hypothetical protein
MPEADDVWWRCEVRRHAHWDYDYEHVTGYSCAVHWAQYHVVRATPKGVWVRQVGGYGGGEQFVLGKAIRQLCVPTRELAQQDEIARRKRHRAGASHRLALAEKMLRTAELHTWEEETAR